ncbi:MAG: hypothetical protein BWY72_02177 [Bacteroidetes bacterium ADurb.Bin416]|nr:MAG: hypothetical protein BWY72_02177 [Bacteroidetes bacterium ADurb.Bin416]
MAGAGGQYNLADVVDGVGYTGVFRYGTIGVVDAAVFIYRHVFQQGITFDGLPDIGFVFLAQVDGFGVATTFVVEHSVIIPSVFVVTDQVTFGVS